MSWIRVVTAMRNVLLAFAIALAAGLPAGWIAAMLLTPILWRLEPVLGSELAGHSGPSDWMILVISGVPLAILFGLIKRRLSR